MLIKNIKIETYKLLFYNEIKIKKAKEVVFSIFTGFIILFFSTKNGY
jgi:hypothetical protein